ncbi:MAG: VWA domain-containing protein [Bacteroidota bacterium]
MKRILSFQLQRLGLVMILGLFSTSLLAQAGYSNAGIALGKERARRGQLPKPEEVVVEEFMNYHLHDLPIPSTQDRIHLDVQIAAGDQPREAVIQVGLSTAFLNGLVGAPPLNISLVVDRSGSMSSENRMVKAREALCTLLGQLRPTDRVSLVAFDDRVEPLFPSQLIGNGQGLRQAIDRLAPRGSTNLQAGITEGYRQVVQHYSTERTQRVLILTDAIANTGLVDPIQIAQRSMQFEDDWQVDCAMICVGSGFAHQVARNFSEYGKTSFHFIDDSEDLRKVFVSEVQSLLAPLGNKARIKISLTGADWQQTYGYESPRSRSWNLSLNDLNHGLTQIFMAEVQVLQAKHARIEVAFTYYDYREQRTRTIKQFHKLGSMQEAMSLDMKKNYRISYLAHALEASAHLFQGQQHAQAQAVLRQALQRPKHGSLHTDQDIHRVENILSAYVQTLDDYLVQEDRDLGNW